MNYYEHHIGDYAEATSHLSFVEDSAYSRLIRKYYATEKPIPSDISEAVRLVGAKNRHERNAVEKILKEFFVLETDGWHQQRCDEVIRDYLDGEPERQAKRDGAKERKKRYRERRSHLFDELRKRGHTPQWDASILDLERLLERVLGAAKNGNGTHLERVTGVHLERTGDAPGTATHSHSPVPSPHPPGFPNPLPPFEKGVSSRRRSPQRAEADEARARWTALLKSGGRDRDSRVQAAIDAVGGWSRIAQRTDRDEPVLIREFCQAYRAAAPT